MRTRGIALLCLSLPTGCGGAVSGDPDASGEGTGPGHTDAASTSGTGATGGASGDCRILNGQVTVQDEADLEELEDVCAIDGHLSIDHSSVSSVHLPKLEWVSGTLGVGYNEALVELDLPVLRAIEDSTYLLDNNALTAVHLPKLETVGDGPSIVWSNEVLTELSLPALGTIGSLDVMSNPALSVVSLPATTTGRIVLYLNGALEQVHLPSLTTSAGLGIEGSPKLSTVIFPSLITAENFRLAHNDALAVVDLPVLKSVTEELHLAYCPNLVTFNVPLLETVGGEAVDPSAVATCSHGPSVGSNRCLR
jgi:hypothetical protein